MLGALAGNRAETNLEAEAALEGVTVRSVVLGLLTVVVMAFCVTYLNRMVKSYLPVAALLPFIVWVGIHVVLKILLPRYALSKIEVLTIFSVVWVASSLPAVGWGLYAVSAIAGPEFFASPENRLREVVLPFLPKWLFLDASLPEVRRLFTGLGSRDAIPWLMWVRPFYWWLVGCLSLVMAGFFSSVLFYKQWHEKERLVFPMATFPVELLREPEGGGVPVVFRDRVFWAGFAFTAGIICWNILGYFFIRLPRITVFDHYLTTAVPIGQHFPDYYLRVQPLIMGLAYLCPLDMLFSFWTYNLVNILKVGVLGRTGFTVGLPGQPAKAGEILMLESHGALTLLVIWSVWVARGHLKETWRKAFLGARSEDDGAPVSYRSAWLGLGLAVVCLGGWCLSVGMGFGVVVIQLVLLFICFFGVTKYAATTGFNFLSPAGGKGGGLITTLGGTAHLSQGSQVMMTMMGRGIFVGAPIRVTAMMAVPHFFRMMGDQLRRHPLLWGAVPVAAYIVGYAACAGFYIHRSYTEGGLNGVLVSWDMDALARQVPFVEGSRVTYFDPQKLGVWILGGLEAGLLTYLRARFSWWPFHPAALAFPTRYGFCLFLVWFAKLIVIRYGGVQLYRKSLPFWYGIIVGYIFGIGFSHAVDKIWFPDESHFVHGW